MMESREEEEMRLTQADISKTKQGALESPRAEDLYNQGFTISEIERAVCVLCGWIDGELLRPLYKSAQAPDGMSGRYVLQKNGRNYDAGHVCAGCMSPKSPTAPLQENAHD